MIGSFYKTFKDIKGQDDSFSVPSDRWQELDIFDQQPGSIRLSPQ
jgi:hypothetical protein